MIGEKVIFAPYRISKKLTCPACGQKSFVPFYDTEKQEIIKDAGRCDRGNSCGYFKHWNDGETSPTHRQKAEYKAPEKENVFGVLRIMRFFAGSNKSELLQYLLKQFPQNIVLDVWKMYYMGCDYYGHTVYPFMINPLQCVAAKMIKYTPEGKRVKDAEYLFKGSFKDKRTDYYIRWVPFGCHLLDVKNAVDEVIIHEGVKNPVISEIIDRVYNRPPKIHMATGGLYMYQAVNNIENRLKNKKVAFVADKGEIDYWSKKIKVPGIYMDFLKKEPGIKPGGDICDYYQIKGFLK